MDIRPHRADDEPGILALLRTCFGRWPQGFELPPAEVFAWKHRDSPFGPSLTLVAEDDGAVVGFVAWQRWRVTARGTGHEIMRAVDVAVDPAYRRQRLFTRLLRDSEGLFPATLPMTFSVPNERSRPGAIKAGRYAVGAFALDVRPCSPLRAAHRLDRAAHRLERAAQRIPRPGVVRDARGTGARRADDAEAELPDDQALSGLLAEAERAADRLETVRTVEYLRWRYGAHACYRPISIWRGDALAGLAVFRRHRRGAVSAAKVCELIVAPGDRETARRLFGEVSREAAADCLTCRFVPGSTAQAVARRSGFVSLPGGLVATVNHRDASVVPDPRRMDSWALCLGDTDLL